MTVQNYTDFRGDEHTKNGHWNDPPSMIFALKSPSNNSSQSDVSTLSKHQMKSIEEDFKQGLANLSTAATQVLDKKILQDTQQRLNHLFNWLNQFNATNTSPSNSDTICIAKLEDLCQAINNKNYDACYNIQTELITLQLVNDLTKSWVGLKRYIDLYKKYF